MYTSPMVFMGITGVMAARDLFRTDKSICCHVLPIVAFIGGLIYIAFRKCIAFCTNTEDRRTNVLNEQP